MQVAYRCISSLGKVPLESHLEFVVLEQDEYCQECDIPVLGLVLLHHPF